MSQANKRPAARTGPFALECGLLSDLVSMRQNSRAGDGDRELEGLPRGEGVRLDRLRPHDAAGLVERLEGQRIRRGGIGPGLRRLRSRGSPAPVSPRTLRRVGTPRLRAAVAALCR